MENNNSKQKKIIAISSSPSKGRNSDGMLNAFIRGMEKIPVVEVEKFYLKDIPFAEYSYENREGVLPEEIVFKELTDKIRNADGLVIATPTYNFSVPAKLKNFIDRIRFFALDFDHRNKLGQPVGMLQGIRAYFLVSGGTPDWAEKILFFTFPPFWLRGVFLYFGAKVMGALYTGDVKAYQNQKLLLKCERRGEKFASKVAKCKHQGLLEDIFWRPPQIKE